MVEQGVFLDEKDCGCALWLSVDLGTAETSLTQRYLEGSTETRDANQKVDVYNV